jgi:UDP-N-acetylmuramate dehydrogenase
MFQIKSLKSLNTLGLGGEGYVAYPKTKDEFIDLLRQEPQAIILGGGSNSVFPDGEFTRKIIGTQFVNKIVEMKDSNEILAECGARLSKILDFAAGVPATVGGGVRINFGALTKEISQYLISAEVFDRKTQIIKTLSNSECEYGYRSSAIKKNNAVVLSALFKKPETYNVLEVVKWRNQKQPLSFKNAGSVFKNPEGNFAGKLIEEAGCKGLQTGDLKVWEGHCNMFVNVGNGTTAQLEELIRTVRERVLKQSGISLELELEIHHG